MGFPYITAGVKQRHECTRLRVKTRAVDAFVQIAVMTSQGQIGGIIRATMLEGNDMVNMEGRKRLLRLPQPAILTAVTGTLAHKAARRRVDHAGVWFNNRRALACSTLIN